MARYEQLSVNELTLTGESITTFGVGAKEGALTPFTQAYKITERGNDALHKTVFTFTNTPFTLLDTGTGDGVLIYTFPTGRISMQGAAGAINMTTTSTLASTLNASSTCAWGVGTVTQQGNGTLATTEQDIIQTTAWTSSATIDVASADASGEGDAILAAFDGTSTEIEAHLNFSVVTATDIDADATITINGSFAIYWKNLAAA